jgi:hypothetical protein
MVQVSIRRLGGAVTQSRRGWRASKTCAGPTVGNEGPVRILHPGTRIDFPVCPRQVQCQFTPTQVACRREEVQPSRHACAVACSSFCSSTIAVALVIDTMCGGISEPVRIQCQCQIKVPDGDRICSRTYLDMFRNIFWLVLLRRRCGRWHCRHSVSAWTPGKEIKHLRHR